ncbi:universal stress protein [Amycolatopsis pithecellobii]|uniref:Universal stress protein n=1 Tax=Amycolatopsis pithecellobii TaxID=664692 RepID=A0A6N7Z2K7_9PSEU|nr:universal stress protein [Amycolatopsis pithecellobii]MTD55169.1 universal stress protein [Amycolatopsis pithecellobii]
MSGGIVAGVDGTRASLRAVAFAAEEAVLRHEPLFVVNGFGIPDAFYGDVLPPKGWLDARREESQTVVRDAMAAAGTRYPGMEIVQESSVDAPIPLLLRHSEEARMVVLGSAGRGVLGNLLTGSTASALTAHAKCPVAVVRGGDRPDAPVVVGVDGSRAGEPALALAFEEASLHQVPLVAFHARHDAEPVHGFAEARGAETGVLAEALGGWQEKFPEVTVERVAEKDRPRHRLLEWSRTARLVVVGSRGRGGFAGLLLGSTSQALVQHARCPVLVARTGSTPEHPE